jgi:ribosomal protein S18 acetylase RimI-like enzyme
MDAPNYEIRRLGADDATLLLAADPAVFDHAIDGGFTQEFLADPRHHIVVALADQRVVGSATATHYIHPDQPPTLFIIEVAVSPAHERRGLAKAMLKTLLAHGRMLGCTNAWVGTETTNVAARALYAAVGGSLDPDGFVTYSFDLGQPTRVP